MKPKAFVSWSGGKDAMLALWHVRATHDVVGLLQNGESIDSHQASCFPSLTKAQIYECLAYYEEHRGEIDILTARQMQ